MSATRTQRRETARAQRRAAETAGQRREDRRRAGRRLGLTAVAALAVVAAMIAVSEATLPDRAPVADAAATEARYAGIPQDGAALGDPAAPVTVVEFVDLQCPFCARFDQTVLPSVIDRYVRPGRVRLELRTLAFIGADSVRAAQAAQAAAAQDRLWPFVDRFFAQQGPENSGYVSDDFLRDAARGISGLDPERVLAASDGSGIARAESEARAAGIESTPSFLIGPTGGTLRKAQLQSLDTAEFTGLLDRELAR
jgi:protein-disulfide isomerase